MFESLAMNSNRVNNCYALVAGGGHCSVLLFILAMTWSGYGYASVQGPTTYGAWSIECNLNDKASDNTCVMKQLVVAGETQKRAILGVMVGRNFEHPMPHILFRINANIDREKGVAVKIDSHEFFHLPIFACDEQVCEIRSFIPDSVLSQMLNGKLLLLAFFLDDNQVTYPVSLVGFDKAYAGLLSSHQ